MTPAPGHVLGKRAKRRLHQLASSRVRRIGDLVAGTIVIVETHTRLQAPLVVRPPPTEAELDLIPRQPPLSQEELDAIAYFLRRSETLSIGRTEELAAIIAPTLARRMDLPPLPPSRLLALVYHRARLEV